MTNLPNKIKFTKVGEAWVVDPEDMLPKYAGNAVLNRVAESFNELRDYLSDKETSNGGRDACARCGCWRIAHPLPTACDKFIESINPPQQEESRGEKCRCKKCKLENNLGVCDDHSCSNYKPQVKEESPKEDGWEQDFDESFNVDTIFGTDNFEDMAGIHHPCYSHYGIAKAFKDYIKANFVSKVKIKREIEKFQTDSSNVLVYYQMGQLLKKLGLEEL